MNGSSFFPKAIANIASLKSLSIAKSSIIIDRSLWLTIDTTLALGLRDRALAT